MMTNLKTLLVSTALGVFLAGPTLAQVTSDTTEITAQVGVMAVPAGTSNLGTGAGQSVTPVSEAFVGNQVMSSDGTMLGTVSSAASQEDGTTLILVELDQAVGAPTEFMQIMLAPGEVSSGQVTLIWPWAEILASLENQNETGADN
ncbi:hypothetical protein D1012_07550 [Pseudotabrizicola alkalilacus]|uniref:PRC-barrel domain-containing protein n=2 Tax=Pseudotabrizicola alkalilacus TaxID=2305252 RepID=A0A411Z3U5_9RHOB|nr:hypothetical protein D1012_07550 [Pseudotabrizicola alkalilacus]